jgi:hypothetical protein
MMNDEDLEFNVGEDEKATTVEIDDEGSANVLENEDQGEQEAESPANSTSAAAHAEELDVYSDKVKKRIDKLTARLRETERREQAAIEYAKSVQQKAQESQNQAVQSDTARLNEAKSRIDTQTVALKQIIRKAREEGDYDTEIEAQERLTEVLFEQRALQDAVSRRAVPAAQPQYQQPQQNQVQYQQQPQRAAYDPKAEAWAEENEWYGTDVAMTYAAQGIHKQMVLVEKFDPTSDEYYDELNKRVREAFPKKFQQNNRTSRNVQTVAPASRSTGINNARRSVKLNASQVAIAKKLGVPLEEYAKFVKE